MPPVKPTPWDRMAQIVGDGEWSAFCDRIQETAEMCKVGIVDKEFIKVSIYHEVESLEKRFKHADWPSVKRDIIVNLAIQKMALDMMNDLDGTDED